MLTKKNRDLLPKIRRPAKIPARNDPASAPAGRYAGRPAAAHGGSARQNKKQKYLIQ